MFKVLVFIDWYLPGYRAGGPVSSCVNMVQALSQDIQFKIVTRNTDYCHDDPYSIPANQWVSRQANEEVMYLSEDQLSFVKINRIIRETNCDVVYINGIYSRFFSIYPLLASRRRNKRVIIASRGMLATSAIGVKQKKKQLFLGVAKVFGLYRRAEFHATNLSEMEDVLLQIGQQTKVHVASNISKAMVENPTRPTKDKGKLKMVSIARIAPEKNLIFLLNVLRQIKAQVELSVFGSVYNEVYWRQCQEVIQQLPDNIAVDYGGIIEPWRVEEIIQQHHLLVLPSLGENFGHVVAESFLAGRPVLVSDQTPWRKLQTTLSGMDLPLSAPQFAEAITFFAHADELEMNRWVEGATQKGKQIAADDRPVRDHLQMFLGVQH